MSLKKCSDGNIEELFPTLLGNYDGPTTYQPPDQQTDMMVNREVTLSIRVKSISIILVPLSVIFGET